MPGPTPRSAAHPYFALPTPLVLGHRGAAGEAPENTLFSFERGLERGAHILESDVHVTRDGVPVLCHDPSVGRTTDGAGDIADLDWEELRRLDAGYRFSPDGAAFPYRGAGLRIPSLEEAFRAFPDARFNLELKIDRAGLVERVVELVQRLDREAATLLTAGEDAIMEAIRECVRRRGAGPALGASTGDVLAFVRSAVEGKAPESEAMALQIPEEFGGRTLVTPELVGHAHAYGVQVHVWTVNEEADMERLLDRGVDGIVTDLPGRLAQLLARRRA
jgi:glycerophosphoryl diester phosphodiesterase